MARLAAYTHLCRLDGPCIGQPEFAGGVTSEATKYRGIRRKRSVKNPFFGVVTGCKSQGSCFFVPGKAVFQVSIFAGLGYPSGGLRACAKGPTIILGSPERL